MTVTLAAFAAPPSNVTRVPQPDAAELSRAIDRLSVVGSAMYVAAHPDDENTGLLAYFANEKLLRTAYLSMTRGEGGQNLLGAERAPWLGVIRTQELLAARGVDGAEQLFGRERDFGYSKSPEETLAIWGKQEALSDVVFAVRRFRPDVIVTGFSPLGKETHGHHTASAQLALEAFTLAGDPTAFPEQLRWVAPWKAKRIVWNHRSFSGPVSAPIHFDVNVYNPVLGRSYDELAALSRSMHKSQGFGDSADVGPQETHFELLAGAPMEQSLWDGVDSTWARVPGAQKLAAALAQVRAEFKPTHPAASLPRLGEALGLLEALPDDPWKALKREELVKVMLDCAGVLLDATAAAQVAVPGRPVEVTVTADDRSGAPVTLKQVRFADGALEVNKALDPKQPFQAKRPVVLAKDTDFSSPYWLLDAPTEGRWAVRDPKLTGLPEEPAPMNVEFVLELGGRTVVSSRSVVYRWTDPVMGDKRRGLEVLPEVTVSPATSVLMFPDAQPKVLTLTLKASAGPASGSIRLAPGGGFTVEPASQRFELKDGEGTVSFKVLPPPQKLAESASVAGALSVHVTVGEGPEQPALDTVRLSYPHIPFQTATLSADVKLVRFELKRPALRIGYFAGAGDDVAEALRQVGYTVSPVSVAQLEKEPLKAFDVLVLGVRAFNVSPALNARHAVLMDFVANGGTLIVQYNTSNRISQLGAALGPYPFVISRDRVTEERAEVTLKTPADPLFNKPNHLGPADFEGWVQERGLYFAGTWDPKYATPLSMHDVNEPPRDGSLLVARHGKGTFIYTGLSFFRQLPAGVPGAYRLFGNLLAHGR